jgi:Zn-dependent membrane protease YugP
MEYFLNVTIYKLIKMIHLLFISYNSALLLMIAIALISFIVQWRFKSKFKQYSEMPLLSGLSGKDVAERMLHDNGIYDVDVISVEGQLTDHYNPADKTVNLSPDVYHSRSVAAAAVAAHECGHAVQHAKAYSWLTLRSTLVPVVNVASTLTQWTLMIGVMLLFFTHNPFVLAIGVGALALVTLFSFVTLPVEFDASNRALAWLNNNYTVMQTRDEHEQAKDALWWAAMTYVIAALSALATLVYYASLLFNRRD